MDGDPSFILIGSIALITSLFFGGMEIVFLTANKLKIELDKKQGVFASGITSYFGQSPRTFVATMLIGQQLSFVLYIYAVWNITKSFILTQTEGPYLIAIVALLLFVLLFLCFAEFIPKALFAHNPNRWLSMFSLPLALFFGIFYPLSLIVTGVSSATRRIFKSQTDTPKEDDADFGRIDLNEYIEQATGNIDQTKDIDHEIQIFRNALDFSSVKARDCLVPRNEIVAIEITDTVTNLQKLFIETRLSKVMVYRESIDHIIGYVHSFELFRKPEHIQHVLRPVSFIPEPMPANEILELFIKQKRHMVVVVDEFGGTSGIITMEDIVEEIFGEIEDEHDKSENTESLISEGVYEFSARLEIDYLNQQYNLHLPVNNDEYDTLGGLILFLTGDIPEENTRIETENCVLIPMTVNEKMIEMVRLEVLD